MIKIKQLVKFSYKFIDYKIGIAGAIVMGGIVFGINFFSTHEIGPSITAALKQGAYTFFLGGALMKSCEYLATSIEKRILAIVASVVIPSAVTLILTFTMHNLKGTPKPLESTLPTLIIIPATVVWGIQKRKHVTTAFTKA